MCSNITYTHSANLRTRRGEWAVSLVWGDIKNSGAGQRGEVRANGERRDGEKDSEKASRLERMAGGRVGVTRD